VHRFAGVEAARGHIGRALSLACWSLSTVTRETIPGVRELPAEERLPILGFTECLFKTPACFVVGYTMS
jgi:hypothetical protein